MRKRYGTVNEVPIDLVGSRCGDAPGPERTAEVMALVADDWTYEAIGQLYDITRERVYQVVRKAR